MTDTEEKLPVHEPSVGYLFGMTEPTDFMQISRDWQKEAQGLILAGSSGMLVYSLDHVGLIGVSRCWMVLTWIAWGSLVVGIILSAFRYFLVPWLYQQWAVFSESPDQQAKERAKGKIDRWNPVNAVIQWVQYVFIGLSFVLLVLAHAAHSSADAKKREIEDRRAALDLKKLEQQVLLDEASATQASSPSPASLPTSSPKP